MKAFVATVQDELGTLGFDRDAIARRLTFSRCELDDRVCKTYMRSKLETVLSDSFLSPRCGIRLRVHFISN